MGTTINLKGFQPESDFISPAELQKAATDNNWMTFGAGSIKQFDDDIASMMARAESGAITANEKDALEKAIEDRGKLIEKSVINADGVIVPVWIAPREEAEEDD